MWDLMAADAAAGISLTDSLAMIPAASVSGLFFGGRCSQYFAVGKVNGGHGSGVLQTAHPLNNLGCETWELTAEYPDIELTQMTGAFCASNLPRLIAMFPYDSSADQWI